MTDKRCAFCGSTRNVTYEDPSIGPICQRCWFVAGDEEEDGEKKKPGGQGPGGAQEDPKQEKER